MNDRLALRRRRLLLGGGGAFAASALGLHGSTRAQAGTGTATSVTLPLANGQRQLVAYPEKRPLIVLTARPPQLETPFEVFNEGLLTPNDAFFVRYHNAALPTSIDGDAHRLRVGGNAAARPFDITVAQLKSQFKPVELVAVNQCSGNSRGLFNPRVTGGQLANGAMGNARWLGVPLKELLARAEPRNTARQVTFDGLDNGVMGGGDFVKALDIAHAMDGEVMVAWQMNGADLPFLNGFPLRLVVPGFYGTYWVKHLSDIQVIDHEFDGFWMKPAYRVPDNACHCVEPGSAPAATRPIGRFTTRSFITSVADGARVPAGQPLNVRGIAFDGGSGVREVAWSSDGGQSWRAAALGQDLGRYSFREFTFGLVPAAGPLDLRVRAVSRNGNSQPMEPLWQPAGYMRNVVESVKVTAV
jgi:DMSO/TMAO reductase YedYZ molybdopterin-dependent catalytic subunit